MSRQRVAALLEAYRDRRPPVEGNETLKFRGTGGADVYNISSPLPIEGRTIVAGRVEGRETEFSQVWFFERGNDWVPVSDAPRLDLQDPFWTQVGTELVVGGVAVSSDASGHITGWKTVLFRGRSLSELTRFFEGPPGMKDLRLCPTADGRIGVFTRPQGVKGGRGKIGFTTVDSLDELTVKVLEEAPLLDQFEDDEWGGANQVHLLPDGRLGVLGHIARFSEGTVRHYYPMAFTLDPRTGSFSPMTLLLERSRLREGPAKRPDLVDVLFPGGLVRRDGKAVLYLGVGDAEAQIAVIDDPFLPAAGGTP